MKRAGFTILELVGVMMIFIVMGLIVVSSMNGCGYYKQNQTGVYQCVKTYTYTVRDGKSHKRVDLRPVGGGEVMPMNCDDDMFVGQWNSGSLYAQFEAGHWYRVDSVGYRSEGFGHSRFPLIIGVTECDPE